MNIYCLLILFLLCSGCDSIFPYKADTQNNPLSKIDGNVIEYKIDDIIISASGTSSTVGAIWFNINVNNISSDEYELVFNNCYILDSGGGKYYMDWISYSSRPSIFPPKSTTKTSFALSVKRKEITRAQISGLKSPVLVLYLQNNHNGKHFILKFHFSL